MGKRIFLCVAVLLMLSVSCIGFANPVEFTATGMYSLKANDTRETAKKQAVKDAMRHAAQMGAVYVESYSTVNNLKLTEDEIEAVAAAIVKVYDENISYERNGMICRATIFCTVDTDNIDLEKILERHRTGQSSTRSRSPAKPSVRYTGVIIDCYDADPADYLILNMENEAQTVIKAEDGRIVYDVMTPEPKPNAAIVYTSRGYDYYYPHAGDNPYWAKALYVEEPIGQPALYSGRIVISDGDADAILAQQREFGLLSGENPPIVVIKRL